MNTVKQLEVLVRDTAARAMQAGYDRRYGDKTELLHMLAIVHTAHLKALAVEIERGYRNVHDKQLPNQEGTTGRSQGLGAV